MLMTPKSLHFFGWEKEGYKAILMFEQHQGLRRSITNNRTESQRLGFPYGTGILSRSNSALGAKKKLY